MEFNTSNIRLEILADMEFRGLNVPVSVMKGEDPRPVRGTVKDVPTPPISYSSKAQNYFIHTKDHL